MLIPSRWWDDYSPKEMQEILRVHNIKLRWKKFEDRLGPLPQKWAGVPNPPPTQLEFISFVIKAYYQPALLEMFNRPTLFYSLGKQPNPQGQAAFDALVPDRYKK